jgi:hypothetical protein
MVRGLAANVINLEQVRMNLEHDARELEAAAAEMGLRPLAKLMLSRYVSNDIVASFEELMLLKTDARRALVMLIEERREQFTSPRVTT